MSESQSKPQDDVARLVDHLFRREAGRLIAILTRRFGVEHLHLAEDVVQDALLKAMQTWPFSGVPQNPTVWLLQTAKHRALDQLRRGARWRGKQEQLAPLVEAGLQDTLAMAPPRFEDEIRDSQLRMMFVCCHPDLPAEAQLGLVLKTLCGFGESEIAAAFLATEAAVTKRLVRARQALRDRGVGMEMPQPADWIARAKVVLHALYLLFNEGYKASRGESLLRADLCDEAIRLAELLAVHPLGNGPATHALLALMRLNAARLPARVSGSGELLVLAEQDRSLWDRTEIAVGMRHMAESSMGDEVTRYHLEAGIAACHCLAPDFSQTDWMRILALYDQLLEIDDSPVIALHRVVAVAYVDGPHAGLRALEEISSQPTLAGYPLLPAVAGHLFLEAGEFVQASAKFREALERARLPAERALLQKKIRRCEPNSPPTQSLDRNPPNR